MARGETRSNEYKLGYYAGYKQGKRAVRPRAYWIMRKDGWYCSNCNTKHEQEHDDFCCKCGSEMSEEADYEDN